MKCRCHCSDEIRERAFADYHPVVHEATPEVREMLGLPIVGGDNSHRLEIIQADGGELPYDQTEDIE